jgi:hypothetical protein
MKYVHTAPPLRRILVFCGIGILVACIFFYSTYQARNLINGPSITLDDTHTIVQSERIIVLRGTTQNIVKLTVNGKEIHTNASGVFDHKLILEDGYSITRITAKDRFGRSISLDRTYVYVPTQFPPS